MTWINTVFGSVIGCVTVVLGGNSSYMQQLVKGDSGRVSHASVDNNLVYFRVKVGTNILPFCLP